MPIAKSEYLSEVWKDGLFADRVVFCTGGNGSICSAQVRALVHLGANACIVGRNPEKTKTVAQDIATARPGSKVLGIGDIDVRDPERLQSAIDRCVQELGGIDFLIAGAAGNFLAPMSQLSINAFKTVLEIDTVGSFNVTKLAMPHLLSSVKKHTSGPPSGRIIYVSATMHYTGAPLQTHVTVAKAGVDALAVNVAIEYGPYGITSNVISPGPIKDTEGTRRLSAKPRSDNKRIPLGRSGTVKEIADATVYLFSDAANYVNGVVMPVDGGAWRVGGGNPGRDFEYPDFILSGEKVNIKAAERKPKTGNSKL
ncbi:hypothetical protein FE257_010259 [Aspergillus nanangensis]|uniref:2,4-dienoyl-CoA reductase [(3E)-enoyl-CoA-producing] n=1 Tax=Aspergillus nanangensis TaxID=2582783 RepID=A0AAD4CIY2_ASPNN|nr:hypothetical protein FE257_010259 [Aspergillus nanangensis]